MKNIETKQKEFVAVAKEMFGENTTQVSRKDVVQMINTKGCLLYTSDAADEP